jgi:hypothetical protein
LYAAEMPRQPHNPPATASEYGAHLLIAPISDASVATVA